MSCSGPAYGMALDNEPRDDDNVAEFDGVRILVDPLSAQYVEGAQVDYVDGLMGRGFTVVQPELQGRRRRRRRLRRRLLLRRPLADAPHPEPSLGVSRRRRPVPDPPGRAQRRPGGDPRGVSATGARSTTLT